MVEYYSTPLFRFDYWLPAFLDGPYAAYDRSVREAIGAAQYDLIMNCPVRAIEGSTERLEILEARG